MSLPAISLRNRALFRNDNFGSWQTCQRQCDGYLTTPWQFLRMPVKHPWSDHLADNRRHLPCRESSQRLGTDVAERAKAQTKRHGGRLIWRFDDCHDVIPSLRPEKLLHGYAKRLRHLFEGVCPLRGFLGVADSLIG